jgi:putative transposase
MQSAAWAVDLLVVQTLAFKTLYVLFFIEHARRKLVQFNVTEHPTVAWVWLQLLNATPEGRQPRYLVHDRDGAYGADFDAGLGRLGIRGIRTPVMAPRANAVADRMVGTFRREFLDHPIVLGEPQLQLLLSEFVAYYNRDRPHPSLAMETPEVRDRRQGGKLVPVRSSAASSTAMNGPRNRPAFAAPQRCTAGRHRSPDATSGAESELDR